MMESYMDNEVLQDGIIGLNRIFEKYNTNLTNEIEQAKGVIKERRGSFTLVFIGVCSFFSLIIAILSVFMVGWLAILVLIIFNITTLIIIIACNSITSSKDILITYSICDDKIVRGCHDTRIWNSEELAKNTIASITINQESQNAIKVAVLNPHHQIIIKNKFIADMCKVSTIVHSINTMYLLLLLTIILLMTTNYLLGSTALIGLSILVAVIYSIYVVYTYNRYLYYNKLSNSYINLHNNHFERP